MEERADILVTTNDEDNSKPLKKMTLSKLNAYIVNTVPPLKHRRPFLLVIVLDSHRVKRER